jgi:hypothetical protein
MTISEKVKKLKRKKTAVGKVSNLRPLPYNAGMLTTDLKQTLLECSRSKSNKPLTLAFITRNTRL